MFSKTTSLSLLILSGNANANTHLNFVGAKHVFPSPTTAMAKLMHQHQTRLLFVRGGSDGSGDDQNGVDESSSRASTPTIETTIIEAEESGGIDDIESEAPFQEVAKQTETPQPSVRTPAAAPTVVSTQVPKTMMNPKLANVFIFLYNLSCY